jgi:exodeoxyribonuclease VII large subunit
MELLGAGALWQEFEKLKQRLANEGLFDESRKRPLPKFPQRIGIVTSRSGAVIQDIRHTLERRYPLPQVFLANTAVQGADAPPQIVNALRLVQQIPDLDVIILARGGGSIEDLWAFNDERVARAICASAVPVVCGVGHETDFTIADFCADVRAPTPTAAAQFCTPDQNELRAGVLLVERRLKRAVGEHVLDARRRLVQDLYTLHRASPSALIAQRRQRLDDLVRASTHRLAGQLEKRRARLSGASRQLYALNPLATLERGYAIVRQDESVVTDPAQVSANDRINIRVRAGEFTARVE